MPLSDAYASEFKKTENLRTTSELLLSLNDIKVGFPSEDDFGNPQMGLAVRGLNFRHACWRDLWTGG